MDHPTPWTVKYWRRCPEWHEFSSPYIVDAEGVTVLELPQRVGHPGEFDPVAVRTAHQIVEAVNERGH